MFNTIILALAALTQTHTDTLTLDQMTDMQNHAIAANRLHYGIVLAPTYQLSQPDWAFSQMSWMEPDSSYPFEK